MEREAMTRSSLMIALAATVAAALSSAPPAFAQDESDQRLGTVHFMTSCNETAQRRFDRGMRYQHSFWYRQAREIFEDVAKADPECGMAFWGVALQSARRAAGVESPARACGHPEGQGRRRQDAARARLHQRARRHVRRLRQDRPPQSRAGLSQGDGGIGGTLSRGR